MPAVIGWYEADASTPLTANDFGEILNGESSDAWEIVLKNDGDETMSAPSVTCVSLTGAGALSATLAWLNAWFEVRATGAGGGASTQTTAWESVGDGLALDLEDIPADGYRVLEVRITVPVDAGGSASGYVAPHATFSATSLQAWRDMPLAGFGGVVVPVGDAGSTYVLQVEDLDFSTLDLTADWISYRWRGEPRTVVALSETLSASTSSAERWVLLSVGEAGYTLTDGAEAATVTAADYPDAPTGDAVVCYARVTDSAITELVEIAGPRDLRVEIGSGLSVNVGSGNGIVSDRAARLVSSSTSVNDDADTFVGFTRGAGLATWSDATDKPPGAEPLALASAASGNIAALVDVRPIRRRTVQLGGYRDGTLSASDVIAFGVWNDGIGYISLDRPYAVACLDPGASSGSTDFDFQLWSGSWVSIFDTLPSVALTGEPALGGVDSEPPVLSASTVLMPGQMWRWVIDAVPSTASEGAYAMLNVEV